MKKLVLLRSGGICLAWTSLAVFFLVACTVVESARAVSTSENSSVVTNTSGYWEEDHPYMYQPRFKRLPDGKVVANHSAFDGLDDFRGAVTAQTPGIARWVLSKEGRHTLKKDLPRVLLYNLVSPMDYGSSLRSSNVRRRRNKAIGMFVKDNLALPLLKTLGRVVWNLIDSHYVGYFEDQVFAQRIEMMNSSELIQAFNLSLPEDDFDGDEESQPNGTLPFKYDGSTRRALLYARYSIGFSPYVGYSDMYYSGDDSFPPPTLPADSYPWLWSPRLDTARLIAVQLMNSLDQNNLAGNSSNHTDDASLNSHGVSRVLSDSTSKEVPDRKSVV